MEEDNNFLQGKEAEAQTFTASRGGAFGFSAMRQQVERDYKKDKLASQYNQGKINEDQYMNGLQGMLKNMREGSTAEREVESSIIGVAQDKFQKYTEEEQKQIQKMTADVDFNWQRTQREYAEGNLSTAEFKERQLKYEEYQKGLIDMDLEEFTFDEFAPGQKPDTTTDRTKAINELYKKVLGRDVDKEGRGEYITGKFKRAPVPWVERTLKLSEEARNRTGEFYSYGRTRNLQGEREQLGNVVRGLGRTPTPEELNAIVYGGYPIELVRSGNYSKGRGFYE